MTIKAQMDILMHGGICHAFFDDETEARKIHSAISKALNNIPKGVMFDGRNYHDDEKSNIFTFSSAGGSVSTIDLRTLVCVNLSILPASVQIVKEVQEMAKEAGATP